MGYTLPSDAAVLEAAQSTHWTEYADDAGIVRAVVRYGPKGQEAVTIGCRRDGGRVFTYVPGGVVLTTVSVEDFTPMVSDPNASYKDYRAVRVGFID
jgi:hypothetical protein